MKKSWTVIITVLALCLAALAVLIFRPRQSTMESAGTQLTVRLPIPAADTAFAPFYLAVDRGFFAREGLNVKLEPGTPELNPVKMVANGTDEFGVLGGPELLLSGRSKGAPIRGIALLHRDSDFVVLLTLKESRLTKLEDLRGKRVGFFYGHISTDVLHMLFRKHNIEVEEVDVGFDYGQLLAGNLHAQWAFRTTAGINLPARGVNVNMISPADYGIVTHGYVIVANERVLNDRPQVVEKFLNGVLNATAYTVDHVQEAVDATVARDPNFQRSVGEKQMDVYAAAIRRNLPIGSISKEVMEHTARQMIDAGLLPKDFDVTEAYTTRFVEEYYKGSR